MENKGLEQDIFESGEIEDSFDPDQLSLDFLDEASIPSDKTLSDISDCVMELEKINAEIEKLEMELSEYKKRQMDLARNSIPEKMLQAGMDSFTLTNGKKIEIIEGLSVSLPKEDIVKRNQALDFIRDQGGEGIIKNELIIEGKEAELKDQKQILKLNNISFEEKIDVHPSTLKSFCKEYSGD